jgi:hypothetical protein
MLPQTPEQRVERLEQRMTMLEELPARFDRLELLIGQLGEQLRAEIRAGDERLEDIMREQFEAAERHARILHEEALARIQLMEEGRSARKRKRE